MKQLNKSKMQFRRGGSQVYEDETDILDLFLNQKQSISSIAFDYNEPEKAIEEAIRFEFIRIRTGILNALQNRRR